MNRLNRNQIIGTIIFLVGVIASFLYDNSIIEVPSGVASAVGVALFFKWIPFKKGVPEKEEKRD